MFNITNNYRNERQNFNVVSPYTGQKVIIKGQQMIGEDVEERKPSYAVGGNV